MNCDETQDALLDYREGQLDLHRRTRLEAHLLVCDRCLTRLRDLEIMLTALADAPVPELPPAAVQRVRDRIAAERGRARPGQTRGAWWRPAAVAAALLVLVAGAVAWPILPRSPAPEVRMIDGAPAGADLDRSSASMATALALWQAWLLEREVLDAFVGLMELPESEVEELLARILG